MLKLVKPSREYLPAFLAVVDDYRADENHFGRGGIDPLIRAIDENGVDGIVWWRSLTRCHGWRT